MNAGTEGSGMARGCGTWHMSYLQSRR